MILVYPTGYKAKDHSRSLQTW